METAVGVVAALLVGVPAIPLNLKVGEQELAHRVTCQWAVGGLGGSG
ncbi:hypothetical protein [Streptomyces sp. SID14515]|nr:hypothetical protein [Streptomyces sp. SID14515]NEB37771.1 hypothetical protein [Streptomyces sp. SID14515]